MKDTNTLWKALYELSGNQSSADFLRILKELPKRGIALNHSTLREIILRPESRATYCSIPEYIVNFIAELLEGSCPENILDPSSGLGFVAVPIAEQFPGAQVYACCHNADAVDICSSIEHKGTIHWFNQLIDLKREGVPSQFDLVVSVPPFGVKSPLVSIEMPDGDVDLMDDLASIEVARCTNLLADGGKAIFVLSDSFFTRGGAKGVFTNLSRLNLTVEACFGISLGAFAPHTQIRSNLVIFSRGRGAQVFVAQLSDNAETNAVVLNYYRSKKAAKTIAFGAFEPTEGFKGYFALEAKAKGQQRERELKDNGFEKVSTGEVATSINLCSRDNTFPEAANAIYVPLIGTGPVVTSVDDFGIKPQNYIQITFEKGQLIADYLAGFLNSPLGKSIRRENVSGTFIPKLTKTSVAAMPLFLAPRAVQTEALAISNRIARLKNELSELEQEPWTSARPLNSVVERLDGLNRADKTSARFEEWIDTLPFPLASILWAYHVSREDPHKAYQHLLHFFEGLSEFVAVILLSAAKSNKEFYDAERSEFERVVAKLNISFARATFGTWKAVVEYYSKRFRTILKDEARDPLLCLSLFKTDDRELVETIVDTGLSDLLQEANKRRNSWTGHGGIVSDEEARERHMILEGLLQKLRSQFGMKWANYELICPTSCLVREDGFDYECLRLMGSRTPFARVKRATTESLISGKNYLLSKGGATGLLLLPLIRIGASPTSERNACYFYNRTQSDGVRFVSYHFEERAEIMEDFPETRKILQDLDRREGES